ncbi:MAG: hemerythrin domain-containing protein [bacterium JZ-2024 1]
MKITDGLLGEHAVFYAQFTRLGASLDSEGPVPEWKAYVSLIASALEPHAQMEEEIFFKVLESFLPSDAGPLAVMRSEHDEIRATIQRILDTSEPDTMRAEILHFLEVARSHFGKEEHILFPLAEQVVKPGMMEQMGDQYRTARGLRRD